MAEKGHRQYQQANESSLVLINGAAMNLDSGRSEPFVAPIPTSACIASSIRDDHERKIGRHSPKPMGKYFVVPIWTNVGIMIRVSIAKLISEAVFPHGLPRPSPASPAVQTVRSIL
jgi:hypothetical protein